MRWFIRQQRGDVPGWVLITAMTAALVVVLWGLAEPQIRAMIADAFSSVTDQLRGSGG